MEFKIEKLIYGGDGLARLPADEHGPGKAVFLPLVLENERVEAVLKEQKRGFVRAQLAQVLEPSCHRTQPGCPYFSTCGGCQYQHSTYEHQLAIKASILKENLRRIAKLDLPCDLKVHASLPWNYRNRTRMQVRTQPEFALGYFKLGSHEFLPVKQCPISSPLITSAIAVVSEIASGANFDPSLHEIEFFADAEDENLLVVAFCTPNIKPEAAKHLATTLRAASKAVGVTVFPELAAAAKVTSSSKPLAIAGAGDLNYRTACATYRVSAGAFFQNNRHLIDALVNIVTAGRTGRTAIDLYAGVGLFSAVLSREFERVIAVESSLQSQSDLAYNVPANVKTVCSTVQDYLQSAGGQLKPDLIVVDPPRGGLGERVANSLARANSRSLTYVSCDPATLARDLGPLLAAGYRVEQAHLVDLFPQTFHLESVLHLER